VLDGSVHLDPHPELRDELRTRDIQDPAEAKQFMRTQVAKRLEHNLASGGQPKVGASLSADNLPASDWISPARIAELRGSTNLPKRKNGKRPGGGRG
jgi:hypothetical protein